MLAAPQIKGIEESTIHNICSGQVIVTLATAVKELVENAVDADATSITITFREYGAKSIEVSDNGKGISEENFTGLTLKHHTSKIQVFEDISDVSTFGFRGEALSSLCALGNLSVVTSTGGPGTYLSYDKNGKILKSNHHARPQGTTVTIENLFQSLPVRHREFLKNIKKEFHKAIDALQAYAMISYNVRLHCINIVNKRKQVLFSTQGKSALKDNVIDVLGTASFNHFTEIDFEESIFHVYGYISKPLPKHGRGSADKQYLFINGRPCDHEKLFKTINSSYRQYEKFQYPIFVIVIEIARINIDVNVTPDKRKLFVDNEDKLLESISKQLNISFEKYAGVYIESTQVQKTLSMSQTTQECIPKLNANSTPSSNILISDCSLNKSNPNNYPERKYSPHCKEDQKLYSDDSLSNITEKFTMEIVKPDGCSEKLTNFSDNNAIEDYRLDIIEPFSTVDSDNLETRYNMEIIESCDKSSSPNVNCDKKVSCPKEPDKTTVCEYDKPTTSRKRRRVKYNCNASMIAQQSKLLQDSNKLLIGEGDIHFNHQIVSTGEAERELDQQINKTMFRKMDIIGQFNLGFILVKLTKNLFIIDQHATDEKFRYETLKRETKIDNQKLISPKSMSLNGAQEELLLSYRHIFEKNGFTFSVTDSEVPGKRVHLTGVPRSKSLLFDESDVQELLWLLSEDSTLNVENLRPSKVHRMFASRACRSAVMIGTALDQGQMREIVDHMADMDHPWNCPHGRPTMRHVVDLSRIS